jgi:hypothetical protein
LPNMQLRHYYYLSSDDETGLEFVLAIKQQTSVAIDPRHNKYPKPLLS